MRNDLRMIGVVALSLFTPHRTWSQPAAFVPPAPGTPVVPLEIPAHVAPIPVGAAKQAARRVIKTTDAQIEYRYGAVGPSGVGKVEIYVTADNGASWVKLGEDKDRKSPALVQLPGDGLFGVRLAITNGNSFGGTAPQPGERPQFFVEVDTIAPEVDLQPYEVVPDLRAIDIRWTANDANLGATPVSLFYRVGPVVEWLSIAKNVKNDGVYRWVLPRDLVAPIYVKLEVADLADNTATAEILSPIVLDHTEVEATLVDVQSRAPSQTSSVVRATRPSAPSRSPVRISPPMQLPTPASLPTLPSVPVRLPE